MWSTIRRTPPAFAATAQVRDLKISVVAPVRPVTTTDEKRHLLHELVLENTGASTTRVVRLDLTDGRRGGVVASFAGDTLAAILRVELIRRLRRTRFRPAAWRPSTWTRCCRPRAIPRIDSNTP